MSQDEGQGESEEDDSESEEDDSESEEDDKRDTMRGSWQAIELVERKICGKRIF